MITPIWIVEDDGKGIIVGAALSKEECEDMMSRYKESRGIECEYRVHYSVVASGCYHYDGIECIEDVLKEDK